MIDGQSVPTFASGDLGLVTVQVPAGEHQVELRFGDTALRRAATWLAGACLLIRPT